ncbi:zinc transporter ZIP9-like [Lingula anatina]|uniref:Zinc transporter ZIP9 n=1 Tax=Lingula anatina TaxID=7574 RepID=A0A1S3H421_LINAN|nr:zinc transporter ZIP9 [Lingula anatina]XP_013390426.1 zinc transporter ZIP9-like [Lingula anatina]|eukprot:XP_013380707.1 zinc transporter ZIP9 [Lingula anatina]
MNETWRVILLSLAMLIGCYVSGSIPLAFTLSEDKLKLVTILGAGLLVGTALAVIIPEGVHTLYESELHKHESHTGHGQAVRHVLQEVAQVAADKHAEHTHSEEHEHSHGMEMHSLIGVALVLGFVFMLLVDQLGSGGHSHGGSSDLESVSGSNGRKKITATLGLVVHAAADGIALGAAASTSQTHVEMIVFIAIMLHKAPAAFGLVSFLLHEGFERSRIRKHLFIFSLAAPVLALITFFGLSGQSKEALSSVNATGLAMLFSAGTFLYVATVHVLPEIANMTTRTTAADGSVIVREQKGFRLIELVLMVVGALLPLILSLGHHH